MLNDPHEPRYVPRLMNLDHSAQDVQLLETYIYLIPNEASRPKFVYIHTKALLCQLIYFSIYLLEKDPYLKRLNQDWNRQHISFSSSKIPYPLRRDDHDLTALHMLDANTERKTWSTRAVVVGKAWEKCGQRVIIVH